MIISHQNEWKHSSSTLALEEASDLQALFNNVMVSRLHSTEGKLARFKRPTFHVPNLMLPLCTSEDRRMNQLGPTELYLGRLYRPILQG